MHYILVTVLFTQKIVNNRRDIYIRNYMKVEKLD